MRNYKSYNKPPQKAQNSKNLTVIYNKPQNFTPYFNPIAYNTPQNYSPYINPTHYNNPQNYALYIPPTIKNQVAFRCTYDIDKNDIQKEMRIINDGYPELSSLEDGRELQHLIKNYEIASKIKILNGFKKKN